MENKTQEFDPRFDTEATKVAIVAMGRSGAEWLRVSAGAGGYPTVVDEVWAINAMGGAILHDRLFHMDDVRIQEARCKAMDEGEYPPNVPVYGTMRWLKSHPGPVYTSRAHPDYPGLVDIPAETIMRACDGAYFNSTVAWALGYALWQRAKWGKLQELHLYGIDFSYPDQPHRAEKGRACVEFLLGRAIERGVRIVLPRGTTLLDAAAPLNEKVYGYDTERISIEPGPDGKLVFKREPIPEEEWPTAREIEDRYRPGAVEEALKRKAALEAQKAAQEDEANKVVGTIGDENTAKEEVAV